ncbi:chitin synthase [Malassezia psittaci]|uniref:chitin synthase n=1 Tax=Malassezia psittaci TaxID=1821823 RepID=A0AAF0F9Y2_9BASI|nr:chitin synthase [Malassezia psittaci]
MVPTPLQIRVAPEVELSARLYQPKGHKVIFCSIYGAAVLQDDMAEVEQDLPADLANLVLASKDGVVSDAAVTAVLSERLARSKPYTWASATALVSVNSYRDSTAMDADAAEHSSVYHDLGELDPHPYALAVRAYHRMLRTQQSQSIVYHGVTDSGKSHVMQLVTEHLLSLSSSNTPQESHRADQVRCAQHVLSAFGCAKTNYSERSSRHATYFELHFNTEGRLAGGKVLAFGLDKHRLHDRAPGERIYAIFYQLLAGATNEERTRYHLNELITPKMLPPGTTPSKEDARACDWTRSAFAALGLKGKHVQGLFRVLAALLHLSEIEFCDETHENGTAQITNGIALQRSAEVLQVNQDELSQSLLMDTRYIGNERVTQMLSMRGARRQLDALIQNLYAVLFAFVVEVVNQKLAPTAMSHPLHLVQLDSSGFVSRLEAGKPRAGHFDDLMKNYQAELLRHVDLRSVLDEHSPENQLLTADQMAMPFTTDFHDTIPLMRGQAVPLEGEVPPAAGLIGDYNRAFRLVLDGIRKENDDRALLADMDVYCTDRAFSPSDPRRGTLSFDINHSLGPCAYTVTQHQRSELDLFPTQQYQLLRASGSNFIGRLFAGPGMTVESHLTDQQVVLRAQVASRPLRRPTPLDGRAFGWSCERVQSVSQQLDNALLALIRILHSTDTCWRVFCIRPNDLSQPNAFDTKRVARQVKAWVLPEWLKRMQHSFMAPMSFDAFCTRYYTLLHTTLGETVFSAADARGLLLEFAYSQKWTDPSDMMLGTSFVCFTYRAYFQLEDMLRNVLGERMIGAAPLPSTEPRKRTTLGASRQDVLSQDPVHSETSQPKAMHGSFAGEGSDPLMYNTADPYHDGQLQYPSINVHEHQSDVSLLQSEDNFAAYDSKYTPPNGPFTSWAPAPDTASLEKNALLAPTEVKRVPTTRLRRWWMRLTWALTWFIPNSVLTNVGGMKRPDVRMAWREKLSICMLIFLLCAVTIFYIVGVGKILCPDYNKAYNSGQLGEHSTSKSYFAAVQGKVYDLTRFYKLDHSDLTQLPVTEDVMLELAGLDLTPYFPVPLSVGCSGLVSDSSLQLSTNENLTATIGQAVHTSGSAQTYKNTKLDNSNWYYSRFLPKMKQYYKGIYVYDPKDISTDGSWRDWAIVDGNVYDLTNYLYTTNLYSSDSKYAFLDTDLVNLFEAQAGSDISQDFHSVMNGMSATQRDQTQQCLDSVFYMGKSDFRLTARCQAQNYILLSFSILIFCTITAKFLSALQLVRKPSPERQDRFVICHIPCYTEDEDSLRKTIDSITVQEYDDKRKLLYIVCDGMITGSGNDRPTPRIVLDILGVDPSVDPEALPFHSIAEGSKQLNYGKVYSGLYEYEGHVVPYIVVIKVGRPTEKSRPGNRGKRDTQVLLMRYLNRVHFDQPMSPLELEMYHHMRNVIGIDPAFYEFILMVDADTGIAIDGLNRLVSAGTNDHSIIAVCGETLLENANSSWWTMVQVYEYYISHNLAKAFESMFGSVTCLPGCFTLYRIRSADKGRPLFISNQIIDDYSENQVDTLHKKNLFALGEDRYLTTLLLKHFPLYRTKFRADASAMTIAPDKFSVLISQRRRWINSTIHNLVELVMMEGLCGFCLFSMRFIVFIDLLGTIILPATTVYMVYLIVSVATGSSPLPIIAIAMIAATYGLQAIIFLLKTQWQYIGWMFIYLLAYPIHSFWLPIYSFWHMDDFSWGNTRVVVGEKGHMKVVAGTDDEPFDESMIPKKRYSEYQQEIAADRDLSRAGPLYEPRRDLRSSMPDSDYMDYFQHTNLLGKGAHRQSQISSASINSYGAPRDSKSGMSTMHAPSQPVSMYGMPPMGMPPPHLSMYGMPQANMSMYSMPMGMPPVMSMYGAPAYMPNNLAARPISFANMETTSSVLPVVNTRDPTDDELYDAIQSYLAAQPSLMHITKRHVRDAVSASMPNADLSSRRTAMNRMIDELLSGG